MPLDTSCHTHADKQIAVTALRVRDIGKGGKAGKTCREPQFMMEDSDEEEVKE